MNEKAAVMQFWFGELDDRGIASDEVVKRWFTKSDAFDRELEERFGELRRQVLAGEHDDWLDTAEGLVAYIVVLDQFSRNIGRGTPMMYEADALALAATHRALDDELHTQLGFDHTVAILMPLMHSEVLEDQERCVELFEGLRVRFPDVERLNMGVKYAIAHRDIVAKYGRFPHRNEIVGRESTAEEIEFLSQPGSSF